MDETTERAMSVAELGAYARAGIEKLPVIGPTPGMRPAHRELLVNAMDHTRTLLTRLAETCERATNPTVGEEN